MVIDGNDVCSSFHLHRISCFYESHGSKCSYGWPAKFRQHSKNIIETSFIELSLLWRNSLRPRLCLIWCVQKQWREIDGFIPISLQLPSRHHVVHRFEPHSLRESTNSEISHNWFFSSDDHTIAWHQIRLVKCSKEDCACLVQKISRAMLHRLHGCLCHSLHCLLQKLPNDIEKKRSKQNWEYSDGSPAGRHWLCKNGRWLENSIWWRWAIWSRKAN